MLEELCISFGPVAFFIEPDIGLHHGDAKRFGGLYGGVDLWRAPEAIAEGRPREQEACEAHAPARGGSGGVGVGYERGDGHTTCDEQEGEAMDAREVCDLGERGSAPLGDPQAPRKNARVEVVKHDKGARRHEEAIPGGAAVNV